MPTIKFTATPELPFDIAHLAYKAGDVLEMSDASARRWVRRGVAVYWTADKQAAYDAKVERKTKLALAAISNGEVTRNEVRADIGLPDLAIALDPVLMPEPANEIGNSDEKPAEAVADVEENGEGGPEIFAGHEPTVATDESPKRRGRTRR